MENTPQPAATTTQAPIYAALLVGGIMVGILINTAWTNFTPNAAQSIASVASSTQEATSAATSTSILATSTKKSTTNPAIVIQDQKAGPSVSIQSLNIAKPTWVVVYVSREGKPGNALGARLFFATDKKGTVSLLRNTAKGQTYFVGLLVDNGDRVFSLSKDKPIADADGGRLWATFSAR